MGKVEKLFSNAIADTYAEGFMSGYKAYEKRLLDVQTNEDGFVNLSLPSGTLWADDFVMDEDGKSLILPYREALDYSIPSEDQWRELTTECRFIHNQERISHPLNSCLSFVIQQNKQINPLSNLQVLLSLRCETCRFFHDYKAT